MKNVQFSDEGLYTCQASNSEGVDQESMQLTVVGKSMIVIVMSFQLMPIIASPLIEHSSQISTIADPGDDVVLECRATGQPAPSLSWIHNGVQVTGNSRHVISGNQLEIKQFTTSDEGSYSCVASNRLGVDERNFTISMKSKKLLNSTINFKDRIIVHNYKLTPHIQFFLSYKTIYCK